MRIRALFTALVVALVALTASATASADTFDAIKRSGKLLWGGDQEGGGPYVFPRDDDPTRVMGFEVDLANKLAEHLGIKAEFAQGNWDRMPDLLQAQKIDIVLNGYEWTAVRAEAMASTIPYYVYGLVLLARRDDASLRDWEDLKQPRPDGGKRRCGVLLGSAAHKLLTDDYAKTVEIVAYEGNTDSMREVETGKIDATVQDTPIASFYGPRFPALRRAGEPRGRGYYVAYARKTDAALVTALNEAIVVLLRSGELERIYRTYGIWDEQQKDLTAIAEATKFFGLAKAVEVDVDRRQAPTEQTVHTAARKRGLAVVKDYGLVMLESAGMTVLLSILSFPCAVILGMLIAVGRMYGPAWMRAPLAAYVELLRGTPLMLQLYFIFFFLPDVGVRIPAFSTAILGLAVNYSAYESEIYRAGLQAIPPGQMEAGLSLGMARAMTIRRIIVPQAFRIVIPPVMNDFIALFKDTSVCAVVTIVELTKRYSVLSMSTQATVELMAMTAVLYLCMSYPMSLLSRRLEKTLGHAPVGA